jgi:hypothetical protein
LTDDHNPNEEAMRDLDKNPYTPDEARVAAFFCERGIGGGDDPIGALMAGYVYLIELRNEMQAETLKAVLRS